MANGQAAVFFAQMNTLSIRPNYGPSCGGTLITLIGTGFCDVTTIICMIIRLVDNLFVSHSVKNVSKKLLAFMMI